MSVRRPRLFVFIVGQLRSVDKTSTAFRANLSNIDETRFCVQCGEGERESAQRYFGTAELDAWDPRPLLPPSVKLGWPLSGEEARFRKSFFFQLVRQYRAVRRFSDQIDVKRDWILKWRPDLMLCDSFDWKEYLNKEAIWLPKHDNFGGYNDQCALGPASLMIPYLTRLERLSDYFSVGGRLRAETFLRWSLGDTPIGRMALPYCIHRGTHLHPVSFSRAYDDVYDEALITKFQSAGVGVLFTPVDLPPTMPAFPLCGRYSHVWQRSLSLFFSGERLAANAVDQVSS